jgi:hypothetical protein
MRTSCQLSYELEKREARALCHVGTVGWPSSAILRAHGYDIRATGCGVTYPPERPLVDMQEPSWSTTEQPRTKSPELDAPRPGCYNGVG